MSGERTSTKYGARCGKMAKIPHRAPKGLYTMDNDLELTIAQVIKKYDLLKNRFRAKSLGQHFMCDASLLDKIVSCALPLDDSNILEIGAGPCGLTRSIIKYAGRRKIICIEKDISLKPLHDNLLAHTNADIKLIYADALKIKLQDLSNENFTIISNLPYNVGTQLLLNWLSEVTQIKTMVLMFQKEVANRIYAKVGTKNYGRLSVISQISCDCEKCFDVASTAFFPPPEVQSSVVKLTPKRERPHDISKLEKLTALCFQYRRKTVSTILKKKYSQSILDCLSICDIPQSARPEDISPEKFLELSNVLPTSA